MCQRILGSKIDINSELRQFIHLLQNEKNTNNKIQELGITKLSVIQSASQHDSSSFNNKENTNSSNSNGNCFEKQEQIVMDLIERLLTSGLNLVQNKLVQSIGKKYQEMVKVAQNKYQAVVVVEEQMNIEKKNTDELLSALVKIDESEQELWRNYNILSEEYDSLQKKYNQLQVTIVELNRKMIIYEEDKQFMQKLVRVANQNYEGIERKCAELEGQCSRHLSKSKDKSSTDILIRSAKTKKNSYSPSQSDIMHVSPNKSQFQDIYRKMVIRTLKYKGKKQPIKSKA